MITSLFSLKKAALGVSVAGVLFISFFFRSYRLAEIPGLNGDEAFPSVQMHELISGRPVVLWVPTQRILSPLYSALVLLVQKIDTHFSLFTVRLPALISGILLILFTLFFLPLERRTRLLAALLLTSFPMTIAYSRSAVEQSTMGVVGVLCLYLALKRPLGYTVIGFALALIAHPVNVFLAPWLLSSYFADHRFKGRSRVAGCFFFIFLILVLVWALPGEYGWLNLKRISLFIFHNPLEGLRALWLFIIYFIRLISGVTAFEYFAVPPPRWVTYSLDLFMGGLFLTVLILGIRNLKRLKRRRELYLVGGFFVTFFSLFYVAGPRVLSPGLSRHANVLIVPFAITISLLLSSFQNRTRVMILTLIVAAFNLCLFQIFYFGNIQKTGGGFTHRTYVTGPREPKEAIYAWAKDLASKHGKRVELIAEDWWIYWPLKFLSFGGNQVSVQFADDSMSKEEFLDHLKKGAIAVGFPGMKAESLLLSRYSKEHLSHFQPESYAPTFKLTAWWVKDRTSD